jgi:type I restriction enzyme R subunit
VSKKSRNETEICDQYITPAIHRAGWDRHTQVRREYAFTAGQVKVRGKVAVRGEERRADYLLFWEPNLPLAVVEAKANHHGVGEGLPQALRYTEALDVPFVFASNGDGFVFHDRTRLGDAVEVNLGLDAFPSPSDLWARSRKWKRLTADSERVARVPYHDGGSGKEPRYSSTLIRNQPAHGRGRRSWASRTGSSPPTRRFASTSIATSRVGGRRRVSATTTG